MAFMLVKLSLLGQFDGLPNLDALEGLRCGWGVKRNDRHIISFTKNPLGKNGADCYSKNGHAVTVLTRQRQCFFSNCLIVLYMFT